MNNPKLILFTGFLGSGKTSLLLKTAKYLAEQHKQCAIIVNEVGEIGIDKVNELSDSQIKSKRCLNKVKRRSDNVSEYI